MRPKIDFCGKAIRPFMIGRKYLLFSDAVSSANASANLYSLIESTKANGIEPYQCLNTVFAAPPKDKILEQIEALLPFKPEVNLDVSYVKSSNLTLSDDFCSG